MNSFDPLWVGAVAGLLVACGGQGAARVSTDPTLFGSTVDLPVLTNAGGDREVGPGEPVCLDGASTYHPLQQPYALVWTQTAGAPVSLSDATVPSPCFVAPIDAQTLSFSLAGDDGSWVTTDAVTLQVVVSPSHPTPRVQGGPDRLVGSGEAQLPALRDVVFQEPGSVTTWELVVPTPSATYGGNAPLAAAALLRLSSALGGLQSVPDYVLLWPFNQPDSGRAAPNATLAGPVLTTSGAAITLDASGSRDSAAAALRWHWAQTCGDAVLDDPASLAQLTLTMPRRPQTLCLRATVRDSFLEAAPADLAIEVLAPVGHPVPPAVSVHLRVHPSNPVAINVDPNFVAPGAVTYHWTQTAGPQVALDAPATAPLVRFVAPTQAGVTLAFSTYGSDTVVDGNSVTPTVDLIDPSVNTPPQVSLCADDLAPAVGATVTLFAAALDAEQDVLGPITFGDAPAGTVTITQEAADPNARPTSCGPLPKSTGLVAAPYQASFAASASGSQLVITATVCDSLQACGAASVIVNVM